MNLRMKTPVLKNSIMSRVFSLVSGEPRFIAPVKPSEWVDDTQLRGLVEDLHTGSTQWVFAYDMDEFLQDLDAYNAARDPASQVSISLSQARSELIRSERNAEYQDDGPQQIFEKDLRFVCNGKSVGAYYSASPHEVNLNIHSPVGGYRRVDFKLADPFHGAFAARPDLEIGMQP